MAGNHEVVPVVPLISKFNATKLTFLTHSKRVNTPGVAGAPNFQRTTTMKVPKVTSCSNDEEFISFIYEFNRARTVLDGDDAPKELPRLFEAHLANSWLADWQAIIQIADLNAVHDVDSFIEQVNNLKSNIFDNTDWENQADYL